MHLVILSRSPAIHTTRRLVEAGRARGHRVRVLDPVRVEMGLGGPAPTLYYQHARFPRTDVVIPRIALSVNQYGLAVVNQLELAGVPALNSSEGIAVSRNKMRCLQLLAHRGIGIPLTVMASEASGLKGLVRHVGGLPVLVKLLSQSEKTGLMVCETLQSLEAALEAILGLGQNILVQQYVKGAHGRDLRAFVVGGRVVGAVRRCAPVGRFARSLKSGARFAACALPPACLKAATETARVVGLEACAVDMLDVEGGPLVAEVNSSPGIREVEEACQVDLAAAMIARAEELGAGRTPGTTPPERGTASA